MKLDEKLPYGTITGHPVYMYEQGGKYFGASKTAINLQGEDIDGKSNSGKETSPKPAVVIDSKQIETDAIANAKLFLANVLSGGAVAKAAIFKESEGTNIAWADVTRAATEMKVIASQRNKIEHWQLSES